MRSPAVSQKEEEEEEVEGWRCWLQVEIEPRLHNHWTATKCPAMVQRGLCALDDERVQKEKESQLKSLFNSCQ